MFAKVYILTCMCPFLSFTLSPYEALADGEGRNELLAAMNHRLQNENQILKEKLASNEVQFTLIVLTVNFVAHTCTCVAVNFVP